MNSRTRKRIYRALAVLLALFVFLYLLQRFWAHRNGYFQPDYPKAILTENTDYETIFLQTGLGKGTVDKLIAEDNFEMILKVQDAFYSEDEVECVSVFGWFTMSERVNKEDTAPLVNLQPGDIILSLSTHSVGWNHGHAGLVIDDDSVLECRVLGEDSVVAGINHWRKYSNYIVLRVEGATEEVRQKVVEYAKEHLCGVPYRLSAGLLGEKAPEPTEAQFGLQCAYLVWYAWQHLGYDLDSDGGCLVTTKDLLDSEFLEIVQVYGINPKEFIKG